MSTLTKDLFNDGSHSSNSIFILFYDIQYLASFQLKKFLKVNLLLSALLSPLQLEFQLLSSDLLLVLGLEVGSDSIFIVMDIL